MHLQDVQVQAERLYKAFVTATPIPPLLEEISDLDVDGAYAIQAELVRRLRGESGRVVGYKLGLTSKPMQVLLGVDQPDFGPVLDSMVVPPGHRVERQRFIQPKIEAELAVHLGWELVGPGVTRSDVEAAASGVCLAVEIIDSRIEEWRIKLTDTVADLASAGAVVLSPLSVPVGEVDPRLVGVVVRRNGELMATGAGAAAFGDPLEAVAWLANTLGRYGERLEADRFVMTGSLHAAFPLESGDRVEVATDRLGTLAVEAT